MYRTIWRRSGCCIDETVPRRQCQQLVDGLGDTHRQRSPKDIHTDLIPLHITPRGHPIHPSVSHTAVSVLSSSSRACMLNPRGRSCIASAAVRSSTSDQHMLFGWIAGSNTLECNVLVPQLVIGGLNAESRTIATTTTGFLLDRRHTHTALTTQLLNTAYPLRSPHPNLAVKFSIPCIKHTHTRWQPPTICFTSRLCPSFSIDIDTLVPCPVSPSHTCVNNATH